MSEKKSYQGGASGQVRCEWCNRLIPLGIARTIRALKRATL